MFGTIAEKNVTFLVDTSGSMQPSLAFLQFQLGMLLHEQVLPNCHLVNMVQFSSSVTSWAGLWHNCCVIMLMWRCRVSC